MKNETKEFAEKPFKVQRQSIINGKPVWKKGVNKQKHTCDVCGKPLWIAPDGKTIYCYCK